MADTITLNIDNKEVQGRPGMTVLQVAQAAGVYIPTLCYHPLLEPYGGCRMCIVEIEKMRGLPPACTTPAGNGMVVNTNTPQLPELRRAVLGMVLPEPPQPGPPLGPRQLAPSQAARKALSGASLRCVVCPKN